MPDSRKAPVRRPDRLVEALLFAALALQLLLLVALVLHGPGDGAPRGVVGSVGRFAAAMVYGAFGVLSYLLVALGLWTTAVRLARHELSSPRWRMAGFALFVIGGCSLVHQFFPRPQVGASGADLFGYDPGGAVGSLTFAVLQPALGSVGAFLIGVVLLCTGLAFATDWLLYDMAYTVLRRTGSLFGVLKRFWPEPALAGAGAEAAAAAPRTATRVEDPADDAEAMHSATLAPAPLPSPTAVTNPAKFDVFDAPEADAAVAVSAVVAAPPAPAPSLDVGFDDPVVEIPEELASRLAPVETPAPAAPAAPAAPVAPAAADVPAAADEEPAKPVVAVKLDAPVVEEAPAAPAAPAPAVAQGPKKFRISGLKVEKPRQEGEYEFPGHDLLERPKPRNVRQLEQAIQSNAEVLQRTLAEFRIEGQVVAYQQGPVVTMLEVALAPGTKVTKIHSLADDIAMALKAEAVRIVAPIPGKSTVGVEIPNPVRDDVRMLSLLEAPEFRASKAAIPMLLGAAADGRPLVEDLATMPHLLIAGSTGSGKSVCINTILLSILMTRTPDDVRLILIDPKQVELAFFANVPHLLSPVVTDMKRAAAVLEWALDKMEERYDLFRRFEVRNIAAYNELGEKAILARAKELEMDDEVVQVKLPYVVIIVDELADLMLTVGKDVETAVTRLAQKSRAVGIHVVLATQRPSTDVITGLIKANMPTRIAFKVASKIDSRVILDANGAEKLLGMGDMLYMPPRSSTLGRAQGTYASDREVKRVVGMLREKYPQEFSEELVNLQTAPLLDSAEKDELYDQAVRIVLSEQRGSASLLQRALSIGYTRASRLLDLMRAEGVVGAYKGSKASEVQMTLEEYEARVAAQGGNTGGGASDDDDEM
jgi:DNA segregation ATPase FtsK/SpoIIIE-like protein